MTVMETEPGHQGWQRYRTSLKRQNWKPALVVQVPPFINEGEKIRVSTAEQTYLERA